MKTPKFWREENILSFFLLPLSLIYWALFKILWLFRKENEFAIKVVCIGNLTAGGAGKTPTAIAVGKILKEKGVNFAYLSSGYGGKVNFCEVLKDSSADEVGDEPILLSEIAPAFVAKNRIEGVKKIQDLGYELVVLDDGMQNNSVKKDFVFLVVDGKTKFGNDMMIPAGPLRQSVREGFKMADRIVVVGGVDEDLKGRLEAVEAFYKVVVAEIESPRVGDLLGEEILAFCGLGYPEKFFDFLKNNGLKIVKTKSFADHYSYKDKDLRGLIKYAQQKGLKLVTTKKDWVKFSEEYRQKIDFLDIKFTFKQKDVIIDDIEKIIKEK